MQEIDYRAPSEACLAARRRGAPLRRAGGVYDAAPSRRRSAAPSLSLAALAAILSLSVAAFSCATQARPAVERGAVALEAAGVPADGRFDAVFDRSGDPGRLVARFLRLGLVTEADDKSGDSTVVVSPDGLVMLIDGGAPECADQVKAYLDALGVERIDAVVASHPHVDHVGGLPAILGSFPVGTVYASRVDYPTATARAYESAIRASGAELVYLEAGDSFRFGSDVVVDVYNPEADIAYYDGYPANGTQFVNNHSIVMRMRYGSSSMLFVGDVYTSHELDLIDAWGDALRADVLKIGHHGSDTSSSKSWIRAVSPRVGVAMHDALASLKVLQNYRKAGVDAYVTCLSGSVRVALDGAGGLEVASQYDMPEGM